MGEGETQELRSGFCQNDANESQWSAKFQNESQSVALIAAVQSNGMGGWGGGHIRLEQLHAAAEGWEHKQSQSLGDTQKMTKAKHGELYGQLSCLFVTLIHGWDQNRGLEARHLISAPVWALPVRRRSCAAVLQPRR